MAKQVSLFPKSMRENISGLSSVSHGGGLRKGKRKIARPFASKKPMHLVLKSKDATGSRSMLHASNRDIIKRLVFKFAAQNGLKIEGYSNVGNHLHIAVRAQTRDTFKKFLRTITGLIARHALKAKKANAKGKFWSELAFTRVVTWGKDFLNLRHYLTKNEFEGEGIPIETPNGIRLFKIRNGALVV